MKCKYCNEEMPEKGNFCPICGGDNSLETEDILEEIELNPEELGLNMEELDEDNETCDEEEDRQEEPYEPSPELKKAKLLSSVFGCVAALAVLAVVLFAGISGNFSEDGKGWDVGSWFSWIIPRENNVQYKDSYTVSEKKALKKREVEVASVPGAALTNGQLQIYYWTQVYDYLNNNSYYLSQLGLDYTSPLDEQRAYDGSGTWQQYFLSSALQVWHSHAAFAMAAKEAGFELDAEYRQELDGLRAEMEADAKKNGYASADAMVQASMGPGCTVDDYIAYMENYFMGYSYFAAMYDKIVPTMDEIEAYYEANKATLNNQGVSKDGSYSVDIRHILIKITELTTSEGTEAQTEGETTEEKIDGYTQAAWDACLAKANEILDQWLAGEKTEESFGELAKTHSADSNASEGGIYTGVKKGDMVQTFNDWCFDVVRQEGDYGIVRTKYGYHIMYFISKEDIWITTCRANIISDEAQKIVSDAMAKYPMEVTFKKIVLGELDL